MKPSCDADVGSLSERRGLLRACFRFVPLKNCAIFVIILATKHVVTHRNDPLGVRSRISPSRLCTDRWNGFLLWATASDLKDGHVARGTSLSPPWNRGEDTLEKEPTLFFF